MTCQRISDMVEMRPEHRDGHGIWSRPNKTWKRRRAFLIPLATADALELDRWAETPVTFTNSRWKNPIARHREDLYLYSPKAAHYTPDGLRALGAMACRHAGRRDALQSLEGVGRCSG